MVRAMVVMIKNRVRVRVSSGLQFWPDLGSGPGQAGPD